MSIQTQVAIVGGGPVGVALALDLAMRGIASVTIEKRRTLGKIPKGQNLTARTLEHFYFWGLDEELRAARLMPRGYPIGEMTAYRHLMSKYWHAPPGREVVKDYYFQPNERLPQYCLEEVLRTKLGTLDLADFRRGWTARTVAQDNDSVQIGIVDDATGNTETIEADYLVGCDGGHSLVREQVGIERDGPHFDQKMLLAVFRSRELHEGLLKYPERSTYRVLHPDDKGYWRFFGRIDVGEGWFFHAPVPAEASLDSFDCGAMIQAAAGFECTCEFDHVGFWDLRVAIAKDYRVGRVFIAGDAAHSHPPYGGFGLNNGLEDAVNLSWKLAACLDGWGADALLDSYALERRPVFKDTADYFIAERIKRDAAFLARHNPDRDEGDFAAAWDARKSDLGSRFQQYEPSYEGSSVIDGPEGGVCTAKGQHMFKARPGHHLAPSKLTTGKNVYEELGRDFNLLAFGCDQAGLKDMAATAAALGIPMRVIRDAPSKDTAIYEAPYILLRPDQYVVWTGEQLPANPADLLRRSTGHL